MRTCQCPVGTYLTDIGALTCPTSFGQVQKIAFQRNVAAGLGTTTTLLTYATWTALQTEAANKLIVTPFIGGFTPEPGTAREFGSGNEVRNGIPIIFGTNPTKIKFKVYEPSSTIYDGLKLLECETALEATLINELGQFGVDATVTSAVHGFPVQSFHVSDRILGGFDGPDYIEVSMSFPADWSSGWTVLTLVSGSGLDLVDA